MRGGRDRKVTFYRRSEGLVPDGLFLLFLFLGGEAGVVPALVEGFLAGDDVLCEEVVEVIVDGVHAFLPSDFHEADDLFDFPVPNAGAECVVHAEDFGGEDATLSIDGGEESLGDDCFEDVAELGDDLLLLVGREDIDETVDALRGIDGVEGGEDEVSGFGGGEGDLDAFQIAEFADHDDVGVLAKGLAEGAVEALRVAADLALFDDAGEVGKDEFDGVLDGDDDAGAGFPDAADHGGEGGGLTGAGDAGDEDEAAAEAAEIFDDGQVSEFGEDGDIRGDVPEGGLHVGAGEVDVSAEATDAGDFYCVVQLPLLFEASALGFREGAHDEVFAGVGAEGEVFERDDGSVDAGGRWSRGGEVEV